MAPDRVARVAVDGAALDFDGLYDYLIPDFALGKIKVGYRVLVPFGRSSAKRQGFVFEIAERDIQKKTALKQISALADPEPLLSEREIALAKYISERTFCTLFEGAKVQLPAGLCMKGKISYAASSGLSRESLSSLSDDERVVVQSLMQKQTFLSEETLRKRFGLTAQTTIFRDLEKKGFLVSNRETASALEGRTQKCAFLNETEDEESAMRSLTAKQRSVVDVLCAAGSATVAELCYFAGVTLSVIMALEHKGILSLRDVRPVRRLPDRSDARGERREICLNREQTAAYESLKRDLFSGKPSCSLLFGVTGSGKTSVYTRLTDDAIDAGMNVIITVPEIALTPQMLDLFYNRYGDMVAVFHSGLSVGDRVEEWRKVRSGRARIAIGTRSAIFAPFQKVGLIVMDEEQENTYKSERSPRYDAADIAKFICAENNALLLLSSATPSVTAYAAAKAGRYRLLTLRERYAGAVLPEVEIVDLSQELSGAPPHIGDRLVEEIRDRLEKKEQTILFINRRGYHTFATCPKCKTVLSCPSCSISMTYHKANGRLMCHYCGHSEPYTTVCPTCGGETVRYSGVGTQKIEAELKELFPDARILRADADTMIAKNAHEEKLRDFSAGKYDILLGTQMVTKGLDFPDVTLVGVISADMGVYKDDYRSAERAFDLLTQVVGRAGRRQTKGLALIQTISPESEVIRCAAEQDYEAFYRTEIENRRMMIYPPFCDVCLVGFLSADDRAAHAAARFFLERLRERCSADYSDQKLIVIGPNPSMIHKIGNQYRYRLIMKCKNSKRLRALVRELLVVFLKERAYKNVTVFADIDPERIF